MRMGKNYNELPKRSAVLIRSKKNMKSERLKNEKRQVRKSWFGAGPNCSNCEHMQCNTCFWGGIPAFVIQGLMIEKKFSTFDNKSWVLVPTNSKDIVFSTSHAGRIQKAYYVFDFLLHSNDDKLGLLPINEYQIRPLTMLPDHFMTLAWKIAVKIAQGKQPSNKIVQESVGLILGDEKFCM